MQLQFLARYARAAFIALAVVFATLLAGNSTASAACDKQAGKELYNCLANKLDHVASMSSRSPETQGALQKAASQLRVATNKAQALSAISQARSVLAGVIQKAKAAGQAYDGLLRVTNTLSYAARLIQQKG
jgi:hypothetical protein